MSLYRRGDIYHFDFVVRGKRYRGSTEQTNEKRARNVESQLIAEARSRSGPLVIQSKASLADMSQRFLKWIESARSERRGSPLDHDTQRYYKNGWRLLENTEIVQMPMSNITKDDIAALRFLGGPSNANCALRTLRRMMRKANEWGLIGQPPPVLLFEENGRERIFTPQQEADFLRLAPQPLRDVFLCCRDAGMRPDEVFRMCIEDIRWERRLIFIPRGKTRNSRRYVPLSQRLMDALWIRCGSRTAGWVFPCKTTKRGKAVSESGHIVSVAKKFEDVRTKMGLSDDYVLYSARHTFGTYLYALTRNLALVMALMGHSDVKTAMRYQHPEFELAIDAINQMQSDVTQLLTSGPELRLM